MSDMVEPIYRQGRREIEPPREKALTLSLAHALLHAENMRAVFSMAALTYP
jgi:hypothetical protein